MYYSLHIMHNIKQENVKQLQQLQNMFLEFFFININIMRDFKA